MYSVMDVMDFIWESELSGETMMFLPFSHWVARADINRTGPNEERAIFATTDDRKFLVTVREITGEDYNF